MKIITIIKIFLPAILFSIFISCVIAYSAFAWSGYDFDNKTEIDIGPGNLVREGMLIQFYDAKSDQFHSAKILFVEEIAGGTRIQLKDLDEGEKERTFIMEH